MSAASSTSLASLVALTIGASTAAVLVAEEPAACQPEMWKDAIADFQRQDEKEAPPKDGIVFIGSSSIRMWDVKKSFPDLPAINRGFGGSQLCDSVHYADALVVKHQPRVVVLYAGDNDIAAGKRPEAVHGDFRTFVKKVHEPLPKTRILFISIKPSIARWKLADKMREANKLIATDCKKEKRLMYVDVWPAMLGEDGKPRKELFREDNLHMNDAGYAAWTKLLQPHLVRSEEKSNYDDTTDTTDEK